MEGWLKRLERVLEDIGTSAHEDFRVFLSAEPPPLPYLKTIPEGLLQRCLKVANEAPADLRSNLQRAWASFDEERISKCNQKDAFRMSLFTLCFYHAVVLGRRRFGHRGWSRMYSFNQGDLEICADVLQGSLERTSAGSDGVAWEDLRYIFGEIMYGGHITDPWDRRTNNTYLEVLFTPSILKGGDLASFSSGISGNSLTSGDGNASGAATAAPGSGDEGYGDEDGNKAAFALPADPSKVTYDDLSKLIEEKLPKEAPQMFGLHPNSEIGYLTNRANDVFQQVMLLEGAEPFAKEEAAAQAQAEAEAKLAAAGGKTKVLSDTQGTEGLNADDEAAGGGMAASGASSKASGLKRSHASAGAESGSAGVRSTVESLLGRVPQPFPMMDLQLRAEPLLEESAELAPFIVVAIQECQRLNALCSTIESSLAELRKALDGQLNMSDAMEDLMKALQLNQVPGRNPFDRVSWERLAWPSRKPLQSWFQDLLLRVRQMQQWVRTFELPASVWLPGLTNPVAFLTAI